MINFYLPNFYEWNYRIINTYFIENIREHPEWFYDNIQIGAVYGTFPGVAWNGGRAMVGTTTVEEICDTIIHYWNLQVPIRFTYTNTLIKEEHLQNSYANIVTGLAENGLNEILVNSPVLEDYLREEYPNYKFLSSTTKCLLNKDDILNEADKYYLTVLDYRKNPDLDFLASLPDKHKYELLINAYCDPNCLFRAQHYDRLSQLQLENSMENGDIECRGLKHSFFEALNLPTVIKVDDLYSTYVNLGFSHFKIEGRTINIADILESYLYYMVKPEYKDNVRYNVLKQLF